MKQFVFFLGLLLAILLAYLCVSDHAPRVQLDIGERVVAAFAQNDLPGEVQVSGRDVTLVGFAENDDVRAEAAQVAGSVYGVRVVKNQIKVMAPPSAVELQEPDVDGAALEGLFVDPDLEVVPDLVEETVSQDLFVDPENSAGGVVIDPDPLRTPVLAEPDYIVVEAVPVVFDACQEALVAVLKKEAIVFESSQDVIKASSHDLLDVIAREAQGCEDSVIQIYGYTDTSGDAEKNKRLSLKRARSVSAYLKDKGVVQEIKTFGLGSSQPVADNATPQGRAQNRRIEFKVIKK